MNWLTNFVKPKLRSLVGKDVPENLWHKCPGCEQMLFHRDLEENQHVCRHCGHHMRIDPQTRLSILFDEQRFTYIPQEKTKDDPLKFKDLKKYNDRLKESRNKLKQDDAIIVASGAIGGIPTVVAVFDFRFMGGSMGVAVGNGILRAAEFAVSKKAALIVVPSSGGARMQEGILSLMQMPRTTIAVKLMKEARLPYITLLTDPTTGGVSASFAMLGDIAIAEPGAMIGFAGARVIKETIRAELPSGFQTAEYLLDHGMIDMVIPRNQLKEKIAQLLSNLMLKYKKK
ncbi:MAG: acetyl-CoA carboxylase carboxyltransferase subunit beta [Caedimonadaceae bacterium]|nr:MAG: acetyl-CoA carboxylase carboxyltransferase subunit beta [Caedimonadaceae bacterium]